MTSIPPPRKRGHSPDVGAAKDGLVENSPDERHPPWKKTFVTTLLSDIVQVSKTDKEIQVIDSEIDYINLTTSTQTDECNEPSDSDSDDVQEENIVDLPPEELLDLIMSLDSKEDVVVRGLASSTSDLLCFNWSSDSTTFVGQREEFNGKEGPTFATTDMSPLVIFREIWDQDIINLIVRETNRCARQIRSAHPDKLPRWTDVTILDLWTFFALLMLQSIVPLPVETEYWEPCMPELRIGNFNSIMSHRRFTDIKKCLNFVNNEVAIPAQATVESTKLAKINPIIDHLNSKFRTLYHLGQNIVIDESILFWKGRLPFTQLIRTKASSVGIKTHQVCDSRTGYLWQMMFYTDNRESYPESEHQTIRSEEATATTQHVYDLIRPLLNKGHTLFMDSFYNSPLLSRILKRHKTDTIGILRLNREFVPDSLRLKTKHNMRPGEVTASHTHDVTIVAWRDTNLVSLISTYHKAEVHGTEKHGQFKYKPQILLDYNKHIRGLDKLDQLLKTFPAERIRTSVGYKKLFRRILNVSIYNAYVIYSHDKEDLTPRIFRAQLVKEMLKTVESLQPARSVECRPVMLGHFPVKLDTPCRVCMNCKSKGVRARSKLMCKECDVVLCINNCFSEYHARM